MRLDAWRGMAEWSRTEEFAKALITKGEYEEFGGEVSYLLHLRFGLRGGWTWEEPDES